MSHRRRFLRQVASVAGAATVGRLVIAERAFATALERFGAEVRAGRTQGWIRLREEYLLDPGVVYLNHASIGTVPRAVHEAHVAYLETCESNPWLYMWGGAWEEARETVRGKAADALGSDAGDVAFTHNTTEGFNVLAQGLPLGSGDEVLFSSLNHPGASVCWYHRAETAGFTVRRFDFPLDRVPELSSDEVLEIHVREISPRTRVLVLPHVDHTIGLRHPVHELARLAHARGVEFVAVDGAQSVGMIPLDLSDSEIDFYAASPHKWIQAPKGLGLLYVRAEVRELLRPMWVTWGQARWARTVRIFEDYGTRNFPELLALGDALDVQARIGAEAKARRYRELWDWLWARTKASPAVQWRSPSRWSLSASLVSLRVAGVESPELFRRLNAEGLVFRAFGGALDASRISPNVFTSEEELDRFFQLAEAAAG